MIDSKAWYEGRLPWFDKEHTSAYLTLAPSTPLVVNTSLVKPGEINSFRDLLKPQWKGKIVLGDPTFPGQGQQWFSVYAREELLGPDFMKALVKQEPVLIRDARLQAEWVSKGKYPVSLAVGFAIFRPFTGAGATVNFLKTEEPDYLSAAVSYLGLINDAPHAAAARLFLNWVLSKEGSLVIQKSYERQSPRADISAEGLSNTGAVRIEGARYYNAAVEEHENERRTVYDNKAKEIFRTLVK